VFKRLVELVRESNFTYLVQVDLPFTQFRHNAIHFPGRSLSSLYYSHQIS
jgi:hypothetical protein